jgi:hypothetical protein
MKNLILQIVLPIGVKNTGHFFGKFCFSFLEKPEYLGISETSVYVQNFDFPEKQEVFFFFLQIFINFTPNGCKNLSFLKRHTPTVFIFSAKIALFFSHIFKNNTQNKFWGTIKTHDILRKQHFFLHMNFLFHKK